MATKIIIKGKVVKRPGVYALTKSGITNPPLNLPYGHICIIDDGSLNTADTIQAGGAGVLGEFSQGTDSVYEINSHEEFLGFVKGGALWSIADALYQPAKKRSIGGVSKVYYVRAAKTTAGTISYTFENGSVAFAALDEGLGGNGELLAGKLVKGYGCKITAGINDSAKYMISFYHGSFKGIDPLNNIPYDKSITKGDADGVLLFTSPEISTVQELIDWCNSSNDFKSLFKLKSSTASGAFVADDITDNAGYKIATGGTSTFDTEAMNAALDAVKGKSHTFYLATSYGNNATNANNEAIIHAIENDLKYDRIMVVGGGLDSSTFKGAGTGTSETIAKYFDSDRVIVVHGGYKKTHRSDFLIQSQFHKAALILGRMCGLPPQTPLTSKMMNIDGEVHKLSDAEQEFALDNGILVTAYDDELNAFTILQGVNSLQNNDYLVNDDGTSHDIAVVRIAAQLNREIIINGKRKFFGQEEGPNRNTVSSEDIHAWLEGFLQKRTASTLSDNLIVRFEGINVSVKEDNYFINYGFVPNYPISKMVFTGVMLES